ncbi:uncharacterized protein LOC126248753 isoform X1 [Schistocerca nitens]|uniref:uncharacterized protein LOC126248753 isoform X1 n=1 Tax=Schistocerca nitens TaxID=7011 RepID=UPI002119440A|nr:uncharacterized protein LOC126248753 isoform X1 [Schistocerca nitens]
MACKGQSDSSSNNKEGDKCADEVDPRVQIELERLNTATDDINKLEVDLDEARAEFRQLLCDSTVRIDMLAKKLGACVERARPYYEARMRAKEALLETQQAAIRFERANSAHAAAKEMVYLAEEGLSTEGRTFDHAWQEMLNHATMRVNESERERTISELEHRRTSQNYHRAEMHVQQLQKELKRAIAKSSLNARRSLLQINSLAYQHQLQLLPYFEMKAQFNQLLEEQKKRVKSLEKQVGQAKMNYAEALRNLEQISDEIHRTRKYSGDPLGARGSGVGSDSPVPLLTSPERPGEKIEGHPGGVLPPVPSSSSATDTDVWSDSTGTGPPDSDSGDEFLKLPDKLGPKAAPIVSKAEKDMIHSQMSEYLGTPNRNVEQSVNGKPMAELTIQSQNTLQSTSLSPRHMVTKINSKVLESNSSNTQSKNRTFSGFEVSESDEDSNILMRPHEIESSSETTLLPENTSDDQVWTEISLEHSPEEMSQPFVKMGSAAKSVESNYTPVLPIADNESQQPLKSIEAVRFVQQNHFAPQGSSKQESVMKFSRHSSPIKKCWTESAEAKSPEQHPLLAGKVPSPAHIIKSGVPSLFRAVSLDKATQNSPVKSKLDSSLTRFTTRSSTVTEGDMSNLNRRQSLDTLLWSGPTTEKVKELLSHGMMMLNISSLTERRTSEAPSETVEEDTETTATDVSTTTTKKVPSPLEKSLNYLTAEDESTSDSESLASVEMLTDEQISSLMLDQVIQDACEEVLGTPISEISPLIQDLKQREMQKQAQPKEYIVQ